MSTSLPLVLVACLQRWYRGDEFPHIHVVPAVTNEVWVHYFTQYPPPHRGRHIRLSLSALRFLVKRAPASGETGE